MTGESGESFPPMTPVDFGLKTLAGEHTTPRALVNFQLYSLSDCRPGAVDLGKLHKEFRAYTTAGATTETIQITLFTTSSPAP